MKSKLSEDDQQFIRSMYPPDEDVTTADAEALREDLEMTDEEVIEEFQRGIR